MLYYNSPIDSLELRVTAQTSQRKASCGRYSPLRKAEVGSKKPAAVLQEVGTVLAYNTGEAVLPGVTRRKACGDWHLGMVSEWSSTRQGEPSGFRKRGLQAEMLEHGVNTYNHREHGLAKDPAGRPCSVARGRCPSDRSSRSS